METASSVVGSIGHLDVGNPHIVMVSGEVAGIDSRLGIDILGHSWQQYTQHRGGDTVVIRH